MCNLSWTSPLLGKDNSKIKISVFAVSEEEETWYPPSLVDFLPTTPGTGGHYMGTGFPLSQQSV